jgi:two-component system nitrate/nitrite response regulator NarL
MIIDMLRKLLEPHYWVVGSANTGSAMIDLAERLKPDIVVLDVVMPVLDGLAAARRIRLSQPDIRLVFLTMEEDERRAAEAFAAGAAGFVLKSAPATELLLALEIVARGGQYLTKAIAGGDIAALEYLAKSDPLSQISAREREVLTLLVGGLAMKQVARRLQISPRTVAFHKYNAMNALNLRDNAALVDFAIHNGLLRLGGDGRLQDD